MNDRQIIGLGSLLILACALGACGDKPEEESRTKRDKPLVLTTFFPVHYLTQEIAKGAVDVVCPLPAGSDPITWTPGDEEIAQYRDADLIVSNGAEFEKWMGNVSLPESRVIRSADPLEDDLIYFEAGGSHSHGSGDSHSHVGKDGHTWVDLENARIQARTILEGLLVLLPKKSDELRRNHLVLDGRLAALGKKFQELGKAQGKTPILASHPAYNYLARRIGLNMVNLDLDPESLLDDGALKTVEAALKDHPAKSILWESEPIAAVAEQLKKQFGLTSFVFSPCEDPGLTDPKNRGDFLAIMATNLQNLGEALAKP
ncbi:MAG: zinc transport system substrate-binding protein [Planctomycetota bacterium]|jgi:zinc transport system substrate-binding protein